MTVQPCKMLRLLRRTSKGCFSCFLNILFVSLIVWIVEVFLPGSTWLWNSLQSLFELLCGGAGKEFTGCLRIIKIIPNTMVLIMALSARLPSIDLNMVVVIVQRAIV